MKMFMLLTFLLVLAGGYWFWPDVSKRINRASDTKQETPKEAPPRDILQDELGGIAAAYLDEEMSLSATTSSGYSQWFVVRTPTKGPDGVVTSEFSAGINALDPQGYSADIILLIRGKMNYPGGIDNIHIKTVDALSRRPSEGWTPESRLRAGENEARQLFKNLDVATHYKTWMVRFLIDDPKQLPSTLGVKLKEVLPKKPEKVKVKREGQWKKGVFFGNPAEWRISAWGNGRGDRVGKPEWSYNINFNLRIEGFEFQQATYEVKIDGAEEFEKFWLISEDAFPDFEMTFKRSAGKDNWVTGHHEWIASDIMYTIRMRDGKCDVWLTGNPLYTLSDEEVAQVLRERERNTDAYMQLCMIIRAICAEDEEARNKITELRTEMKKWENEQKEADKAPKTEF